MHMSESQKHQDSVECTCTYHMSTKKLLVSLDLHTVYDLSIEEALAHIRLPRCFHATVNVPFTNDCSLVPTFTANVPGSITNELLNPQIASCDELIWIDTVLVSPGLRIEVDYINDHARTRRERKVLTPTKHA